MKTLKQLTLCLFLTLLGLVFSLGLLECGFRLLETFSKKVEWSDRPTYYFQHEASPTLQDYPYTPDKPENTFRIAVVGDSFSFAPYMQFTDAFPKKLEQMLNMNSSPLKAQVLNYGVPAYSTSHEVPKVEQAIKEQADLIILQITLNDPEIKAGTPIGITNFSRFGELKPGPIQQKLFSWFHCIRFIIERVHNTQTVNEYKNYFLDLFDNPKTWKPFAAAMKRIADTAQQHNTKLVAVVFPLFGLPLDASYPFYPIHQKVDELLNSLSIPHTDLSPFYKDIPLERLQVIPGGDRHPNEIGHRIAAERIYDWLCQQKDIPEQLMIKKRFTARTQIIKEPLYTGP